MKRRTIDRNGNPVANRKLTKRGLQGGWRIKETKISLISFGRASRALERSHRSG